MLVLTFFLGNTSPATLLSNFWRNELSPPGFFSSSVQRIMAMAFCRMNNHHWYAALQEGWSVSEAETFSSIYKSMSMFRWLNLVLINQPSQYYPFQSSFSYLISLSSFSSLWISISYYTDNHLQLEPKLHSILLSLLQKFYLNTSYLEGLLKSLNTATPRAVWEILLYFCDHLSLQFVACWICNDIYHFITWAWTYLPVFHYILLSCDSWQQRASLTKMPSVVTSSQWCEVKGGAFQQRQLWHERWPCRVLWAQHAGFCSPLFKAHFWWSVHLFMESQNHRMSCVGRERKDHQVPPPLPQVGLPFAKSSARSDCPGPHPTWP